MKNSRKLADSEKVRFFAMTQRLTASSNPAERKRIKKELARMTFGGQISRGRTMTNKANMTGMQGVYRVAAELTKNGLIVSPTSRSAFGADLLVTDQKCERARSVQVKTNAGRPAFWLLNKHAGKMKSATHIYVLVNLRQENLRRRHEEPDFYVVPSRIVARCMRTTRRRTGSIFYSIHRDEIERYKDRWEMFV